MDFVALEQKIEKAARSAFIEMFDKHKSEGVYCFALYSDDGAMTVCPSTNTTDFLDNLSEKEKEELAYYKFEPAEWKYEMIGADKAFNEICKDLRTELEKNDFENEYENNETFSVFQNQLYEVCFGVLKKLKGEKFFKKIAGKDIFLIFSVSEYEFESDYLKNMISELNNDAYKTEYLNWMKTWAG